ncbi:MAG: hypothetical protein CGU29_07740 [Candidatus Dactylopiibacterium carminicum]|uniref:Flagellar hook-length control protein FliK n=1 Tax=Candidatus Dactylopiibacterium carminicum TaxID=857335 RepID=A0A272ETQ0_9RHOO|nr:flagellar hook-length control protein FliK [Candidatus Dactylopiibacterium carminicum]KAF7599406.1 flagellar hook-length control protein FliK [Candidatus Dactylopiibacterium carminicum]PAS93436.1 MAG: hypothetical protein CGU29_07740 [Candidatus Dactylopiibacterium carminicum]PAS99416.1 MAG: hypothetical protein BSR46_08105 [Candidatus Dactylopiibacterium carminicum]
MASANVNPVSQIQAALSARPANAGDTEGDAFVKALEARKPATTGNQASQSKQDKASAKAPANNAEQAQPTSETKPRAEQDTTETEAEIDTINLLTDGGNQQTATLASTPAIPAAAPRPELAAGITENTEGAEGEELALTDTGLRSSRGQAATQTTPQVQAATGEIETAGADVAKTAVNGADSFAENLSQAMAQHGVQNKAAEAARETPTQHVVQTPVGSRGWTEELGQKVVWSASHDNGLAELTLTPPQLGKIQVSINLQGDQAQASFVAANALARETLQDAMPRLREILAQAGIQLGQANVGSGQSEHAGGSENTQRGNAGGGRGGDGDMSVPASLLSQSAVRSGRGMIDIFA